MGARWLGRLVTAAVYGGTGAGVLGATTLGVLVAQGFLARRTVGTPTGLPLDPGGRYRPGGTSAVPVRGLRPLRLAVLGDSAAAGFGVDVPSRTPGATVAQGLADAGGRPVDLVSVAVVGAQSEDLDEQLDRLLGTGAVPDVAPDVAFVVVGANDVTHLKPVGTSVGALAAAVGRLHAAGTEVVVGTCPDLGTIEPFRQPLRSIARALSRRLAAAQTEACVAAGARAVSLADLLGPEFADAPAEMFGPDRFHPSAAGYAAAARVLLPSVCAAAGLPEPDTGTALRTRAVRLPVALAAATAAETPGAEVSGGTSEDGDGAGAVAGDAADAVRRGPWAWLRRRPARTPVRTEPVPAR